MEPPPFPSKIPAEKTTLPTFLLNAADTDIVLSEVVMDCDDTRPEGKPVVGSMLVDVLMTFEFLPSGELLSSKLYQ